MFTRELRRHWPIATLIALCITVFIWSNLPLLSSQRVVQSCLMIPQRVTVAVDSIASISDVLTQMPVWLTLFTYSLFHGDSMHVLMNMVFLWLFGTLVHRELGTMWVFITFCFTAITGAVGQILLDPDSMIPVLGASGSVVGFEGVYFLLAVRWRLPNPDVWPLAGPISPERLVLFAIIGVFLDVSGIIGQGQGIAFGAHLGGFVGGALIGSVVQRKLPVGSI